jgi:hypothetical protein
MKSLWLLAALAATPAVAAEPLRPMSACLDPNRARSWQLIDSDEILVDAGRQKFHLTLTPACIDLSYAQVIGFRSGDGIGRVCGGPLDTLVMPRRALIGVPCRIVKVTPLTKEEYKARMKGSEPPKGKVEVRGDAGTSEEPHVQR